MPLQGGAGFPYAAEESPYQVFPLFLPFLPGLFIWFPRFDIRAGDRTFCVKHPLNGVETIREHGDLRGQGNDHRVHLIHIRIIKILRPFSFGGPRQDDFFGHEVGRFTPVVLSYTHTTPDLHLGLSP